MEDRGNQSSWPFIHLEGGGSSNQTVYMDEDLQNQYYNFANAGNDQSPYLHATLPHRTSEHMPQNYFDFLSWSGGTCQTQEEIPLGDGFASNALSFKKFGDHDQMTYQGPSSEESPVFDLSGSEYQVPSQNLSDGHSPAGSSKTARHKSKEKAVEADRRRRLRISDALDALQEQLPTPTKKCMVIDDVVDRISYLQKQIKELSQGRLGAGFPSTPLTFVEGHGHYRLSDQAPAESMEEMIGKLFESNPSVATQLLESKGLYIKPMAFTKELSSQT